MLLENIATAVLVGPDQLASLHKLLLDAAAILGMEAPDLYVRQVWLCPCLAFRNFAAIRIACICFAAVRVSF